MNSTSVVLQEVRILRVAESLMSLTCPIEVSKNHILILNLLLFDPKLFQLTLDHPTLVYFIQTISYFLFHSMVLA